MTTDECSGFSFLNQDIIAPAVSSFSLGLSNYYPLMQMECSLLNLEMGLKRIMAILAISIFIYILLYHFYNSHKYKVYPIKEWMDNSIFSIFDEKNEENPKKKKEILLDKDILNINPEKNNISSENDTSVETKKEKQRKNENLEKNVYLLDFEAIFKFFFPKCCIIHFYNPICDYMKNQTNHFKKYFLKYSKAFSFYCVVFGIMLFRPLDFILSLLFANKCLFSYDTTANYTSFIFMFWDLFAGFIYTFNIYFSVTFIVIRREIQKIQPQDRLARAELLWYTFKKGLGFGFLIFLIKLFLIANTGMYFLEIGRSPSLSVYSLARQLIFLSILLKSLSRSSKAIKNDCEVVKEQANIDLMLHHLYRNSLGKGNVFQFFALESEKKKSVAAVEFDANALENYLEDKKNEKVRELKHKIKINDQNIFKNVLLKSFKASSYPKVTVWFLTLDFFLVLCYDILILASFKVPNSRICETNYLYIIGVLSLIVKLLEFLVLPKLFFETVKKKNFFGREEENGQK